MNILEIFQPIRAFVFDVDGVLTDGSVWVLADGQQVRNMSTRDGFALQLAIKQGYPIAIISGGESPGVRLRLEGLGITDIHMGVGDKRTVLGQFLATHQLDPAQVLYMGDDMPDHGPMEVVGLPCCPSDAATEILCLAKYISPIKGGHGCVRDVIEKVLKLNDHWLL